MKDFIDAEYQDPFEDFEGYWYDVDRRWQQEDIERQQEQEKPNCSISDDEKNWASKQMDRWISKFA